MATAISKRPSFPAAVWRGISGRCPNCGRGRLFRSYLKPVDACEVCREPFGHIRADDAPPWLTILVVGHLVVPVAVAVDRLQPWPDWLSMMVWPLLALALALIILPRAKGLFLAAIWLTRGPGSERD
ncbi:MAG: DUF983 domain-containing protein [Rhodospirillales bacterium]|nr:DUF983 domain-containing protein [Rhodospirillales bacterium]